MTWPKKEFFDTLDLGLSRILRYSYGGFLLLFLAIVVDPWKTSYILRTMSPAIFALAAVFIGAGIYAVHRSVFITLHHLAFCGLFAAWDKYHDTGSEKSCSPTRWLRSIGIERGRRMLAYTALRHSDLWGAEERRKLNIAHAENGLVVMTFEGFLVAGIYATCFADNPQVEGIVLFVLSFLFFLAAFPMAFQQHITECLYMKARERRVRWILDDLGFLNRIRKHRS